MTSDLEEDAVSINHFAAFGGIVHSFGILEWSMQLLMGVLSEQHVDTVMVVTKELSYRQKRNTLYSLMEMSNTKPAYRTPVTAWLDEADGYNTLRNNICHALWTEGKRPLSIKPMTLVLRSGKGKMVGVEDHEKDYTEIELAKIADRLRTIHNELHKFIKANFPGALPE